MSDVGADWRIKTREELERLYEDRLNDPPAPTLAYPRPNWEQDPYDQVRIHIRLRERRIRLLENRLYGKQRQMEREFDGNS